MYTQRHFLFFDEPELIQAIKHIVTKLGHGAKVGGRAGTAKFQLSGGMLLMMVMEEELRNYRSILSKIPKKTYGQRMVEKYIVESLEADYKDGEDVLDLVLET